MTTTQATPDANNQNEWATQQNPEGFFRKGTIIVVEGMSRKVENGRFVVEGPFPFQPSGGSYHQWIRLTASGRPTTSRTASAIRGGRAVQIARMLAQGTMRIAEVAP